MTGSAFDQSAPDQAQGSPGAQGMFGNVRRLVPASGIQFLDAAVEAKILPMVRAWFTEDCLDLSGGQRRVLLPLSNDASADGTIWHPVTFRPLGPTETFSFTGLEAVEPFLDRWTPVPFLRYLGRDEGGKARFDKGPANWARVFVSRPERGLRGADSLQLVYAFDTRLDLRSRADQTPYLAPNTDDALFASTFMLADDPEELADFLSQPWIDTWVRESCALAPSMLDAVDVEEAGFSIARGDNGRFTLTHIGRYLAFLRILAKTSAPPQIRFVDSVSRTMSVATTAVELVIDFGAAETTALLIERDRPIPADLAAAEAQAVPLRLRDLSRPVTIHTGAIPTAVEFDHQTFGNAALSRRSGRTDAFQWTSLVRAGREAQRLALRTNATDGVTGLNDVASQISNTAPSEQIWRFSTPDRDDQPKSAPMVTGEALRHLTETGAIVAGPERQLAGPGDPAPAPPAVRPRFSQSSIVGLYVVELLLQAIGEVNSAGPGAPFAAIAAERNDIRRIERIVLMSPLAMPAHERQTLTDRVNGAIDLLWRTQGWDRPSSIAFPAKPQLTLGVGPDVGLQLVYLFNEVKAKFGGGFSTLVDCVRRRTGEPDARDNIRIASIELGQRSAGLTVIDYDVAHDGSVQAGLVLSDRTPVGAERVIEAIIEHFILPAVERELHRAGISDAHRFLIGVMSQNAGEDRGQVALGKGLFSKIFRPAAVAVFETYAAMPRHGAEGLRRFYLESLVDAGGGRMGPVAAGIDEAAATAGATGFKIASTTFSVGRRQVQALVESELWPTIDAIARAVQDCESDILLLVGDLAQLPDLLDHVLSLAPVPGGRIVVLGPGEAGTASASVRREGAIQNRAVLGAYLAGRNLLEANGFKLATRGLARALGNDIRPGIQILQGPAASDAGHSAAHGAHPIERVR